jgi:hypothetical protein
MALQGVPAPKCVHDRPLVRGKCKRLALSLLPRTTSVVVDAIQRELPDISSKSAVNRAYQALLRLEAIGGVVQDFGPDGSLWRLGKGPRANNTLINQKIIFLQNAFSVMEEVQAKPVRFTVRGPLICRDTRLGLFVSRPVLFEAVMLDPHTRSLFAWKTRVGGFTGIT